jgi:Trp operon repressor
MSVAGASQREISQTLRIGLATATRSAKAARENSLIMNRIVRRTLKKA